MFQKFIICSYDDSYIFYMGLCICYVYVLFFLRLTVFFMPVFPVIAMQRFDFKNIIIAIKLFIVNILNLYLTSEYFLSKSHFSVSVL